MTSEKKGRFNADGLAVLIGSVPLADYGEALQWIIDSTPNIPLWPQLPSKPLERMLPQFIEGISCVVEENPTSREGRIFFDTAYEGFEEQMLAFYEDYLAVSENPELLSTSRFKVSPERAAGLFLLTEKISGLKDLKAVKGQLTGPFTLLTGIKDRQGRAGYYDDTIRDMIAKGIRMKAAWQTRLLGAATDRPVIMFIDEPALAGLGSSAFISVDTGDLRVLINEVVEGIHEAGGLAGIHVCANTDWNMLLGSDIDILSFDAHGFFDRLAALKNEVLAFLDRGGIIAWGGVPTGKPEDIEAETTESLVKLWEEQVEVFVGPDRDKAALLRQTLITPSCGTGSLSRQAAARVLELTRGVSEELRSKYL